MSPVRIRLALFFLFDCVLYFIFFRGHSSIGRAQNLAKDSYSNILYLSVRIRWPRCCIVIFYFYGAVAQLGRAVLKEALAKALAATFLKDTGCRFESGQLHFTVGNFLEGGNQDGIYAEC